MNDERIVEVIEQAITVEIWDQPSEARELALEALAALRASGFDIYRPDEFFLVPSKAQEDPDFEMPPLAGGEG